MKQPFVKQMVLAVTIVLLSSSCAAYKAQHASAAPAPKAAAPASEHAHHDMPAPEPSRSEPMSQRQIMLISELDKFQEELKANGLYDCCVKPACRQCAITAGECHCRRIIDAEGPCCGECTQSWVEGRGNTEGVDREQVLAHLGCVRELYEKKTPEGIAPPAQRKDQ